MLSELGHPITTVLPCSNLIGSPACRTAGTFYCGVTWCRFSFTKCTWLVPQLHHMQAPQLILHGQLDASSLMVRVEVMTPCVCVGGADRTDEQVVVYNCGFMLGGFNRSISTWWSAKAMHPVEGMGGCGIGGWEDNWRVLAKPAIEPHNMLRFVTTWAQYMRRSFSYRVLGMSK